MSDGMKTYFVRHFLIFRNELLAKILKLRPFEFMLSTNGFVSCQKVMMLCLLVYLYNVSSKLLLFLEPNWNVQSIFLRAQLKGINWSFHVKWKKERTG